jgi:hypothetical protein
VRFRRDAIFDSVKIGGEMLCWDVRFNGIARFLHADLGTFAVFDGSQFRRHLDLRFAKTSTLVIDSRRRVDDQKLEYKDELNLLEREPRAGLTRRTSLHKVDLRGCAYDALSAYLFPLLDAQLVFDRYPFMRVEQVLRRSGLEELADDVYYRRRRIDGNLLSPLSGNFVFDRFVRWTTGYGVRPERLLVVIALLVAIGTIGFHLPGTARPKSLEPAVAAKGTAKISAAELEATYCKNPVRLDLQDAFWLTLHTVSPVEIPPEMSWTAAACPMPVTGWKNFYFAALLKIFGVVFVGFAAATFTGFLRYIGSRP